MLSYLRRSNRALNGKSTEDGGPHLGICVERLTRTMETSVRTCSGLAVIPNGKTSNMKQCYNYRFLTTPFQHNVLQRESRTDQ
jgi:hypothetical protein